MGWICGTEEKAKGEDFNQIKVQTLDSFGDPLVSTRLVSGILEYARDREAGPVYFSLNDPERVDEAVLIKAAFKFIRPFLMIRDGIANPLAEIMVVGRNIESG